MHINILTLIKLKRPPRKNIFLKKSNCGGRESCHRHKKDSNYLFPYKMFVLSMTAHTSAILPARLKKKKKAFFQSHSPVHNRLYSPIALGGLEVPLHKERHREVPASRYILGGTLHALALAAEVALHGAPICCLAHRKGEGCLSQTLEQ